MVDYVVTQRYVLDDAVSAGADAAAASMERMADAADKVAAVTDTVQTKVTAQTRSITSLVNANDQLSRLQAQAGAAARQNAQGQAAVADALAAGTIKTDVAARTLAGLADKEEAARLKLAAFRGEAVALPSSVDPVTGSIKGLGASHDRAGVSAGSQAFALRQLGVQSVQAFSSIASGQPIFTTLVQQGHQVVDVALSTGAGFGILRSGAVALFGALTSVPVAAAAVVAGLGYAAYSAEAADRAVVNLSQQLRTTRDDYASMAAEIQTSSRIIAAAGITSQADAATAGSIIGSSRDFTGSAADLQNLIRLSADVARSFDEGITPAAGRVAAALKSPSAAAQSFADQGLRTMNQSLVDTITRLDDSGQHAAAAKLTIDALATAVGGSASAMTPLQTALHNLETSFTTSDNAGRSWGQSIGEYITEKAAAAVNGITALKNAVDGMSNLRGGNSQAVSGVPQDLQGYISSAATRAGLNPQAVASIYNLEAVRNPDGTFATSSAGAVGPMQIKPDTFNQVAQQYGLKGDINDPLTNITAGALYLRQMIDQFHSVDLGVAAYNAGPGTISTRLKSGQSFPDETQAYLQNFHSQFAGSAVASAASPITAAMASSQYGPPDPTADQLSQSRALQTANDRALKSADSIGSPDQSLAKLNDTLTALKAAQAEAADGTTEWTKYQRAIQQTQAAIANTGDPIQKLIRSMTDTLPPLQAADGASRTLAEAQNQLTLAAREAGRAATPQDVYAVQAAALSKLSAAFRDNLTALNLQITGQQKVTDAYGTSYAAGQHATDQVKAQADALKYGAPGQATYAAAVNILTTKYDEQAKAAVDLQTAKENLQSQDQLAYIAKENDLVGATVEQRNHELAVLQETQKIIAAGGSIDSPQSRAAIAYAGQIADGTTALQEQQQAIQDLQGMATQAFDQVGTAISDAFVGGSGQAVNFGNVAKSVMSAVLQQILKLAVINPILNSVLGTNSTTLSTAIGAVSAVSGGSSAGGGSSTSLMSLLGLGNSASSALGGPTAASLFGNSTFGGLGDSISGILGTQLWGGSAIGSLGTTTSEIPIAAVDQFASATSAGTAVSGGATIGSLLGGVGLGFGAGSLLGGLIAGNSPSRQTNSQIGAGGGAIAGAIIGSVVPVIGTVLGGLIGGVLGGGGGGLIGPPAPNHGYSWILGGAGDQGIQTSNTYVDPIARDQFNAEQSELAQINAFLKGNGLSVSGAYTVGGNNHNPSNVASLDAGFGQFAFTSGDTLTNNALAGKSFASPADLQNAVAAVQAFEASLPGLLDPLNKNTTGIGTLQTALNGVNTTYSTAIATAQSYGRATDDLTSAQATATQALQDAADKSVQTTIQGFTERMLNATAGGSLAASLLAFDDQAQQQRDAFSQQLTDLYGDAYKSTASYTAQTLTLEQTLSAERLKITQQYYDQGRQQVLSVIQSLTQYTSSLALSSASPLSSQDQYSYAASQFQSISKAALGGDFTSLQGLQGAAQDFLTASRNLNGSGTQYAADYAQVTAALGAVAGASSDQLTASAMGTIQQTASDQLTAALASLGTAVTGATVTNGVTVASSIYTGLDTFTAGLVSASNDNTADLIANFQAIAASISASSSVALDSATFSQVQDYQTTRVVNGLAAVQAEVAALRAEVQHQAAAPASFSGGGSFGGGGGDGGSIG